MAFMFICNTVITAVHCGTFVDHAVVHTKDDCTFTSPNLLMQYKMTNVRFYNSTHSFQNT